MCSKQKNNIGFLIMFLFLSTLSFGQIGIGTEKPTQEFEVKGTVIFRDLEQQSSTTFNRQVMADSQGNLTAKETSSSGLFFKNIVRQTMGQPIAVRVGSTQDLGVNIKVEIEPYSEAIVVLSYNIPVFIAESIKTINSYFATVKLYKNNEPIYPAFRKFTFPVEYNKSVRFFQGMFLDGKYVDVVKNDTGNTVSVTYSLKGGAEGIRSATVYFSDAKGSTTNTMGVGTFSAMIFNRTY